VALKRTLIRRKTIKGFKATAENFSRQLTLKNRSGLVLRARRRGLRVMGGPAYRRKFNKRLK